MVSERTYAQLSNRSPGIRFVDRLIFRDQRSNGQYNKKSTFQFGTARRKCHGETVGCSFHKKTISRMNGPILMSMRIYTYQATQRTSRDTIPSPRKGENFLAIETWNADMLRTQPHIVSADDTRRVITCRSLEESDGRDISVGPAFQLT